MKEYRDRLLRSRNFIVLLTLIGIVCIIPMVSSVSHAGITQLTNDTYKDISPAWSPDGSKIAFASNRGGDYDIWVINPEGTGLTNLTNTSGADEKYPSWSPNGTTIAYTKNIGGDFFGQNYLCTMGSDGSNPTELDLKGVDDNRNPVTYWGYETKLPVWSPDGSQIAFVSFGPDGGNYKIYTYTLATSGVTEVTPSMDEQNSFGDIYRIWWSVDVSGDVPVDVITYDRYPIGIQTFVPNSLNPKEVGHSQYKVMIPGGQTPQEEGNTPTEPSWSPDGTKLLFTRGAFYQPTDTFAIFVPSKGLMIPLDQVIKNATWGSWSPDGTKLAFVNDISGNSDIQVTTLPEFPSTSPITGTYTVFEYERGFFGGTDTSWGNTTSQRITKSVVTFSPDGTFTSTYNDEEQYRSITEDQTGNNIFQTTNDSGTGPDNGTYFVSADGTVTLLFMRNGQLHPVTAYVDSTGNTVIFGNKDCDYTNHKCDVSMGIGVKQGSGFSAASLKGTYIVGEFGSGFSGGPDSSNWGNTDDSFISRHVVTFDGAGGFTVTNPEQGEIHRTIGNTTSLTTGDNLFTTSAPVSPELDPDATSTYSVSDNGTVTLNFPDGNVILYLSADGNSAIFSESEFDNNNKSCDVNVGIGIKQGSNMGVADLKGAYVVGEFNTEFHGKITMSAGWGAWDSETMSKNMIVFDGAGNYTLSWMDLGLKQEISEASVEGGPFLNSYNVEEPWEDISGSETGTYTVSPDGLVNISFMENGQTVTMPVYLSADKNTIVRGGSNYDSTGMEASTVFATGVKKSSGFQLLEKGNINGIGDIDLGDAIQALQVVSGLFPPGAYFGADLNGDGKIGLEEAVYILQYVANLR